MEYFENKKIEGAYDKSCAVKCVNGIFLGKEKNGVLSFRGIPFAKPPIGRLRWKDPVPVVASDNVYEAYYNGKSPIQTEIESEQASLYEKGEDCLYLNIWTKATDMKEKKKAVMVFIHGGAYGWGGTADPLYDGQNFVESHPDIVLVTISYRIGLLGFVDFSEVAGGESYLTSGNLGILDQICALRYIQTNIGAFGGDASNVTLFGESAGGGSVSLLPIIPQAKGLFKRVIAQSGSIALTYSKKECKSFTKRLLKISKAKNMEDLLKLSEDDLKAINEHINDFNNYPERDGIVLPFDLYDQYQKGFAADVDMLIGTNADEVRYWIHDIGGYHKYKYLIKILFENHRKFLSKKDKYRVEKFFEMQGGSRRKELAWYITEFYNEIIFRLPAIKQAEEQSKNGGRIYMYFWKYPSSIKHLGACHAVELAYVFNNLEERIYTGEDVNEELAKKVQEIWTNFAKTGEPSIGENIFKTYELKNRYTIILDKEVSQEAKLKEKERKLLEPLLKYNFNGNYSNLSPKVPTIYKTAAGLVVAAALTIGVGKIIAKKLKKGGFYVKSN